VKAVYENLYHQAEECFGMRNILSFLERHPEIKESNHDIERNEGLKKSIESEKKGI